MDSTNVDLTSHMNAMGLVDVSDATHVASTDGDWFDPQTWANGEVPGNDARVVIPDGIVVSYGAESDARLFTVRIDGKLEFKTDANSKIIADTIVVTDVGELEVGTRDNPVSSDVSIDILIANNGAIDTNWDPGLISRGLLSLGKVEMVGSEKNSHEKVIVDPSIDDTFVQFSETPVGWSIGDKIVISGSNYDVYDEPEDEVRIITDIQDGIVFFDDPLIFDHASPRQDLKISVANYTRNISIQSESGAGSEVYERGHTMFMHSNDVFIKYVEFDSLGRTDKSTDLFNSSDAQETLFDSNVGGRYSVHIHRTGLEEVDAPVLLEGNAVFGSPGWGIVHHASHAVIAGNATYDTFGAGYVAESGNETGSWIDNIAIYAQGVKWGGAKGINKAATGNIGISGDGFWFSGRMVEASDNVAASVSHGFIYFHRIGDKIGEKFSADIFEIPGVLNYADGIDHNKTPILLFDNNEAYASRLGFHVVKSGPKQGHNANSILDGFTAWNVKDGANLQYTSHYVLKDFDIIATGDGISFGQNTYGISIINPTIEGARVGLDLKKSFSNSDSIDEDHHYAVVTPNFINVGNDYLADTSEDLILNDYPTGDYNPDLVVDGPLEFSGTGENRLNVVISGMKSDGLGFEELSPGPEEFIIDKFQMPHILEHNGYYTTDTGDNYVIIDVYFSDRLTGDIFSKKELVKITNINLGVEGSRFEFATFNGVKTFAELQSMVMNSVELVRGAEAAEAKGVEYYYPDPDTPDDGGPGGDPDGNTNVINGTNGDDILKGTAQPDEIFGRAGDDDLSGLKGDDTIVAGDGNDILVGGGGSDLLDGGRGHDTISAGGGNDELTGGAGSDSLRGGFGSDTLNGGNGDDTLHGNGNSDYILGNAGNDLLSGGGGSDTFSFAGQFGKDTITDFLNDSIEIESSLFVNGYTVDDIFQNNIEVFDGNTIVSIGENEITVENTILSISDFIIV